MNNTTLMMNNTDTYDESQLQKGWQDYQEVKIANALYLYISPVLLTVGTIGNICSFLVLMTKNMRRTHTYQYLAALAITDTFILYIGLFIHWLWLVTEYRIKLEVYNEWICKTVTAFGYTSTYVSAWLIVIVTIDRFIGITAISNPRLQPLTRCRPIYVICGVVLFCFALCFHFFWTQSLTDESGEKATENFTNSNPLDVIEEMTTAKVEQQNDTFVQCSTSKKTIKIWNWLDIFLYSIIPFTIIIMFNVLLIRNLMKSRAFREEAAAASLKRNKASTTGSNRQTPMLLVISFAFLLLTLPATICKLWLLLMPEPEDWSKAAKLTLLDTICTLLMFTNHSTNFFMYLCTGQKFQDQFCQIFKCKKSTTQTSRLITLSPKRANGGHTCNTKQTLFNSWKERNSSEKKTSISCSKASTCNPGSKGQCDSLIAGV